MDLGAALGPLAQMLLNPLGEARCSSYLLQGVPHVADLNRSMRRIKRAELIDTEVGLQALGLDRIPGVGRVHREPDGSWRAFHDFTEQPLLVVDLVEVGMDRLLAGVRRSMDELVLVAVAAGWNQIDGSHAKDREPGDGKIVVTGLNRYRGRRSGASVVFPHRAGSAKLLIEAIRLDHQRSCNHGHDHPHGHAAASAHA